MFTSPCLVQLLAFGIGCKERAENEPGGRIDHDKETGTSELLGLGVKQQKIKRLEGNSCKRRRQRGNRLEKCGISWTPALLASAHAELNARLVWKGTGRRGPPFWMGLHGFSFRLPIHCKRGLAWQG